MLNLVLLVVALMLFFPGQAFAYLDPGTGSMVFQTVVAALAAAAYGVRMYWGRIRRLFSGKAGSNREGDSAPPPGRS